MPANEPALPLIGVHSVLEHDAHDLEDCGLVRTQLRVATDRPSRRRQSFAFGKHGIHEPFEAVDRALRRRSEVEWRAVAQHRRHLD